MGSIARMLLIAAAIFAASGEARAELRSAQHPGAICNAYPPYRNDVAIPYQYLLFGVEQGAYCHIRIDDLTQARHLYLVFVYGANLRVRLCLHRQGLWVRCGAEREIGSSRSFTWVSPPSDTPSLPSGAFLSVRFTGGIALVDEYEALWSIPE